MSHAAAPSNPRTGTPKLPPWLVMVVVLGFLGFAWYQNRQRQDVAERDHRATARPETGAKPASQTTQAPSREVAATEEAADEPVVAEVTPEVGTTASRDERPPTAAASPTKATASAKPLTATDRTPAPTRAGPNAATTGRTAPDPRMSPKSPTQPTNDPRRDASKTGHTEKQPATRTTTTAQFENQTIRDFGKVVFKGTIDLQPTLDRIARGDRNTHRNDGSTFGNREGRLPRQQQGYYTEYVHPTKGINGPGPQRVICGKSGDIWYTPDHYETFKQIK